MAVGQLIMHGREHLVGITAHKKGLMLVILRMPTSYGSLSPISNKIRSARPLANLRCCMIRRRA
jgi:non-homologous end joining protein Ku